MITKDRWSVAIFCTSLVLSLHAIAFQSLIVLMNLDGGKPQYRMPGMFQDTYPSASNGTVTFDRKPFLKSNSQLSGNKL